MSSSYSEAPVLEGVETGAVRPLRRSEYDRLVALGAFEDERLELLEGKLVEMSPQGNAHVYAVRRLDRLLQRGLGDRAEVQIQGPVAASDLSEPGPDVAVLEPGDYLDDRPKSAHAIVEVADSSRGRDLGLKARLYAGMGVPDYWVLDLERRQLIVHRSPQRDRYGEVRTLDDSSTITLLLFPDVEIRLSDILPPR